MKLHELHVGELHAGAVGNGVAVTSRDNRIRRVSVNLAAAARREHGGVGDNLRRPPGDAHACAAASSAVDDQIQHARLLEDRDALALLNSHAERASNLGTGLVAVCVYDAMTRVCRFPSELELPVGSQVELGAGGLQLADPRRTFLDQHLDRGRVTQRGTGGEGVFPMELGGIPGTERGGNAALRIGGCAIEE
jgi:hypothetical protein